MSYTPAQFAAEIALNGTDPPVPEREGRAHASVDRGQGGPDAPQPRDGDAAGHPAESELLLSGEINLIINKGKAGNLTVAQMGAAMDAVVAAMP